MGWPLWLCFGVAPRPAKPRREEWVPWSILTRAFSPQTQLQNLTWGFAPGYKISGFQPGTLHTVAASPFSGSGSRFARWLTEVHPTSEPAGTPIRAMNRRKDGPQILDVGHPAYSKREMATRRSSARRRYSSCTVRSARSWSVVCSGSEAIRFSMASMSVATDASFSFKRSEGACGMANSLPPEGVGIDCYGLMRVLEENGSRFARWPTLSTMKPSRRWGTQI
jgi:hypothetical protein